MTLHRDSGCFAQILARGTSPLTFRASTPPMIVDISAPTTPSLRGAVDTSQPHGPGNSLIELVGLPRIRTRPAGRRPRTSPSQSFLLPRRTRVQTGSGRAALRSTPVGRLLVRPIGVPQSSPVSRGPRETYHKTLRTLRTQFDNLTPPTPRLGQLVDSQMVISPEPTPRSITMRQGNSVPVPDLHKTLPSVVPEPF